MNTMASANLGLSLLSRGVGEEKYKGKSRKLEVLLEPEDYFNIRKKGLYLPPIHQQPWAAEENMSGKPIQAHKTYTTRKGALLLYAEDLALSYPTQNSHRKSRKKSLEAEDTSYLSTMKDLRSAILSYGAKEESGDVFMGFTNSKINTFNSPRTVRPGFSAKRYLSNWSKSWDDSILNYLRSEGHLWDKNLFESNSVLPSSYRRINDDMSGIPPPYRVTRNMLVSPGDIMSYEFYRIRPDDIEYGSGDTSRGGIHPPRPPKGSPESKISQAGMIAAIARDRDQKPHPVIYSQLRPDEQQIILQSLILQSAAHHGQDKAGDDGSPPGSQQIFPLDMGEAIVHLVNENSKNILSGGSAFKLPEATIEEQYTESTPSESSWPDVVEAVPYTEVAPHLSSASSIPVLPPINIPNQPSDKTDESTHLKTSNIGDDIKLPDINRGTSLLGGGRGGQNSTESFKKSIKSELDGENVAEHGDKMNPDGTRSNQDSVSHKLQKTGSKHSVISNEENGSVLSISSQLSQSFENLNQADEHLVMMKGGVVPKNRTEGMRSYKGSKAHSSAGSQRGGSDGDVLSVGDDNFSVVGSIISAPNNQSSENIEHLKQALGEDEQKDEESITKETSSSSRQDGRMSQQDPVIKIPSEMAKLAESSELSSVKDGEAERKQDAVSDADKKIVDSEAKPLTKQTQNDDHDDDYDGDDDVKDESSPRDIPTSSHLSVKKEDEMKDNDGDDKKPLTSEMARRDPEVITEEGIAGGVTSDGASLGRKEMEDTILSTASKSEQLNVTKDDQQIPTALIGNDLTQEAEVSEKSFPKSKKKSATSVLETPQSPQDDTEIEGIAEDTSGSDEWGEAVLEADGGEALTRERIPETDDDAPLEEAGLSSVKTEEDGPVDIEDGNRGTDNLQEEHVGSAAQSMGTVSTDDNVHMENYQEDENMISETSDKVARSRHNSSRSSLLMEQLEEQAAAIAEAVIQRPKSGRDLAEDAQLAATLWRERLGQLLQARPPPDDTQSMIYRRRKNSLDGSSVASSDVGLWDGTDLFTGVERKSRRQRRVSSAQATVDLLNPSLNSESYSDSQMKVIVSLSEDEDDQGVVKSRAFSRGSEGWRGASALSQRIPSAQNMSGKSLLGPMGDNLPIVPTPPVSGVPQQSKSPSLQRSAHSRLSLKSPSASADVKSVGSIRDGFTGSDGRTKSGHSKHSRSKSATSIADKESLNGEIINKMEIFNKAPSFDSENQQLSSQSSENIETMSKGSDKDRIGKRNLTEDAPEAGETSTESPAIEAITAVTNKDSSPSMEPAGGDNLQLDVTNFGVADKTEQRRASESKEDDELKKIVADSGLMSKTHPGTGSSKKSKSSKSSKSQKSDKSSKKSGKSQKAEANGQDTEKTKEFIVSMPRDDKEDYLAYKPIEEPVTKIQETGNATKQIAPKPPKKPKKVKKEKLKKTKKQESEKKTAKVIQEKKEAAEAPSVEKAKEPELDESEDVKKESVAEEGKEAENEEDDEEREDSVREEAESPEFIIIHEEFSDSEPEEEVIPAEVEQPSKSDSPDDGPEMSEIGTEYTEDSSNQGPDSLTRSQARAAKRAAETERKKREIEKKRKEKEAAKRKAQEEQERKEKIMMEFEEERRRKEEQMRMKQEAEENAKKQAELAKQDRERQAALAAERERKQQEEYKKKLEALAKKKKEEDKLRQEMEEKKRKEEEERRKEEEEMMAKMAEEERIEYEKRKREEELIAQIKAEEERLRREIEAKLAQEEAERIALEMAKRQKELEIRLQFNRELNSEANVFAHSQEMTRAFTWSYFELLEYLGIPIPENMRERYLKGQLIPQNHKDHGEPSE